MAFATKHPSEAVLLDHAAGTLSFAHDVIVTAHAADCPKCQATITLLENIGDALNGRRQDAEPPHDLLERCLGTIQACQDARSKPNQHVQRRASYVDGVLLPLALDGLRQSKVRWIAPGLRHSTLWRNDQATLHFLRVRAGVSMPAHSHSGLELTYVLSGTFRDEKGHYRVGDVAEQDDEDRSIGGAKHHNVSADQTQGCVCILATTGKLRFSGLAARLFQPVTGF